MCSFSTYRAHIYPYLADKESTMPDTDDSITLRENQPEGQKIAAEDVTLFDKTSYEEKDQAKDPLEVSPDLHKKQ